ncbi:MAG TPA: FAD-dependent oxidoreductase [Gemmataceae bacterium]|jgi:nitrite reductase (NADH) large subunit|nr:FAD-dependent oxidoreductase [Gemmataceae bacterium]
MIVRARRPVVVVVGTGMAGGRFVEELLTRAPDRYEIRMFGAEPHGTYNRILLSHVLGGEHDPKALWLNSLDWYRTNGIFLHAGVRVDKIDLQKKEVIGGRGKVAEPYDYLVLATGSRPFVPPIEGSTQKGVFVFRTLEDCTEIAGYAQECDRAVVLGGGLLGLEAAKGLLAHGLQVTVLEVAPHLMAQQLDAAGGALLRKKMEALGVTVRTGAGATKLVGDDGTVNGVQLADGTVIATDMVVVSCGIRPNIEVAKEAGLAVERAIVVNDQLQTSDPFVFAIGECVQHRGQVYGLVEPVWEQAKVAAHYLADDGTEPAYTGTRLGTTLKVMGVDLTSMGDVSGAATNCEVVSHLDPAREVYKKFVLREGRLEGAILLGEPDVGGRLLGYFKNATTLTASALEMLTGTDATDDIDVQTLPDDHRVCNCNDVSKGKIALAIQQGKCSVGEVGACTKAGTGCGSCQPTIAKLIEAYAPDTAGKPKPKNKIEVMKEELDGLDAKPRLLELAKDNEWKKLTEDDKQRGKWSGLFFRKPTPGHFMMRVRFVAGRTNAQQWRALADLGDEFGKGFCDLTTRQQIQLRWFTLGESPEIWRRLEAVGLTTKQTGMDSIRGLGSCPVGSLTPHEAFDAYAQCDEYDRAILDNKEFTNLPRKLNAVMTGCLENCTHTETQDIALIPAEREGIVGFNVLIGGKQGSGGYKPATPLDVFVTRDEAAQVALEVTRIFRDHGPRELRTRARLYFLLEDRGIRWYRSEVERRLGRKFPKAGADLRTTRHVDHLGIHPQKTIDGSEQLHYAGLLVPAGRITTTQMRSVAALAERYGNGDLRMTVGQNVIVPNVRESSLSAFQAESILKELSPDPSPIMRGLVVCTGNDYCHQALIDTKGHALEVARELERRTAGRKVLPLSIHWSGCPASCGMHQVSTIGMQGCRSRVNGQIVDAAHVYINGKTGPKPVIATDLMYDVPCDRLADALEPLVLHLPR